MDGRRPRPAPPRTVTTREVYASPWWRVEEHDVVDHENRPEMYNVLSCGDGVSVLAVDADFLFLIREYKYALGAHVLQLCSGSLDAGETSLQAAQRELREETGLTAATWTALGRVHPYPTNVVDAVHLFVAEGIRQVRAPESAIELLRVHVSEVGPLIERNEITHASSLVCLLRYLSQRSSR